jgi:lipopolysaccharide transport system permease protein
METAPIIIRPNTRWWRVDWPELWEYRDLILLLVRRDFVSRYKQNVLGPAWFFLTPLAMTLVFQVVFHKIARIPTDGLPGPLFYMSGLYAWNLISGVFSGTAGTFSANLHLFSKVYFPRLCVPVAQALSTLLNSVMQLLSFAVLAVVLWMWGPTQPDWLPGWGLLLLPIAVALALMLGIGLGLIFSSLTAQYRDLAQILPFITQVWLYLSAVIFPVSSIPADYQIWAALNPAIGLVSLTRCALLSQPLPDYLVLGSGLILPWVCLLLGILLFNRTARTVVDTL